MRTGRLGHGGPGKPCKELWRALEIRGECQERVWGIG